MKGRPTNTFSEKVRTPPPVDKVPSKGDPFLGLPLQPLDREARLRQSEARLRESEARRRRDLQISLTNQSLIDAHNGARVSHDFVPDVGFFLASRPEDDGPKRDGSLECIEIGIASPEQIRRWAERRLSTGEVVGRVEKTETVDYKTLLPHEGGLFCERIFGPIKDYSCGCVKGKRPPLKKSIIEKLKDGRTLVSKGETLPDDDDKGGPLKVCPECKEELTPSSVRRERLGFIELVSSVTHSWFWYAQTSPMTTLLGASKKWGETILQCTTFLFDLFDSPTGRNVGPSVWKNAIPTPDRPTPSIGGAVLPYNRPIYNRCHTVPYSPLVASSPIDYIKKRKRNRVPRFINLEKEDLVIEKKDPVIAREVLVSVFSESPTGKDRPILRYCQLERPALRPNFSDLLTYHQKDRRLEAAQEALRYTGGDAIRRLLERLDLPLLKKHLRTSLERTEEYLKEDLSPRRRSKILKRRRRLIRRIKLTRSFLTSNRRPEWMVLSTLPVLPPALRPIIRTADGIIVSSDLNTLYRKILFANQAFAKLPILSLDLLGLTKRTLQEAVDALIDNGKGGKKVVDHNTGQPLKSISALLKGKKGRFRHNLLGKRVDYSGRSVIIVAPTLLLHQCGLPREMAIELFHPFLIRHIIHNMKHRKFGRYIKFDVRGAKQYIAQNQHLLWDMLEKVMEHHPVLLNRAPTLHRLGIQAFQPILVQGRAVHLNPLVCTGFNADFDGDQMGVHIPLSFSARAEAWRLLWSPHHILSPATGHPIVAPTQDMVLGCYYISSFDRGKAFPVSAASRSEASAKPMMPYFANVREATGAFTNGRVTLHTPLWVRFAGLFESDTNSEEPLEVRLHSNGRCLSIRSEVQQLTAKSGTQRKLVGRYIRTTAGRILMHEITSAKLMVDHPASTVSPPRRWLCDPKTVLRIGARSSSTIREKHPSWKAEIEEGNEGSRRRRKKGGLASIRGRKKGSQQGKESQQGKGSQQRKGIR